MSEFDDRLAAVRSARLADLQLLELLHKQVRLLDERVGELEAWIGGQRQQTATHAARSKVRGVYCGFCGRPLGEAKNKRLFCSRGCANRWHHQHPGMTAKPKMTRNGNGFASTIIAGEGERTPS
jgi:hypothetical protein